MALKFVADETLRVVDASIIPEWCTRGRPCAKISTNRVTVTAPACGCWIVRIGRYAADAGGGVIIISARGAYLCANAGVAILVTIAARIASLVILLMWFPLFPVVEPCTLRIVARKCIDLNQPGGHDC